jgi:hypothetical protein
MTIREPINTRVVEYREHPLKEIAAQDVRGLTTEEEAARLRSPEWVEHFFEALIELKQDVETQLSERKSDYDMRQAEVRSLDYFDETWAPYKSEYMGWRKHAVRFLNSVKNREREARRLVKELERERQEQGKKSRELLRACKEL